MIGSAKIAITIGVILILSLALFAVFFISSNPGGPNETATLTRTATLVSTLTQIQLQTTTETLAITERVYNVTFQQIRYCDQYNIVPWAVTLDGLTEVEPSNQSLPLPSNTFSTIIPNQNLTRITFFVPSGTYNYTVLGGAGFDGLYPTSGVVKVNGSDVFVSVSVFLSFTCTSSTTGP